MPVTIFSSFRLFAARGKSRAQQQSSSFTMQANTPKASPFSAPQNILPAAMRGLILSAAMRGMAALAALAGLAMLLRAGSFALAAALPAFAALIAVLLRRRKTHGTQSLPEAHSAAEAADSVSFAVLDKISAPLWLRGEDGALRFANAACRALAAESGKDTHTDIEALLSPAMQSELAQARRAKQDFSGATNLVVGGNRHIFQCRNLYDAGSKSFVCTAEDITEAARLRAEAEQIRQGYAEVFDRLSTSVAIFGAEQKLEFFNSAFAALWPLETQFLESAPSHALLLDRLREKGILNERPDWRQWKDDLFEAYRALTPQHYVWNLPDGRTLRVVASPHPQGGVTWLFDDLSEKLALQARYNALIKMQGETLDNLSEGVALFGADGRLRLSNPAFAALWHLPPALAAEGAHIEQIRRACAEAEGGAETEGSAAAVWRELALCVTGFAEQRESVRGRVERRGKDARIFDYVLMPLPQGQSMLTFVDATDSVHIRRALHERNAALESADRLRNDFVRHVSYELRTPLTNIMGFTDLALSPAFGSLSPQQRSYLQDIGGQSALLLNLVNDILDLATVDAGIMELNITRIAIADAMRDAGARVKEQLSGKNIRLEQHIAEGLTEFDGDEARIRQIFINLLSNAVKAAPVNSAIRFSAAQSGNALCFSVEDEGAGIPPEHIGAVFKRFTSYAQDGHKTGIGLGLSIVKSFVELHQGQVSAENRPQGGAKLICRFPFRENAINNAINTKRENPQSKAESA